MNKSADGIAPSAEQGVQRERNLEEEVAAGRFRRDLHFRLNGMTLQITPLRARRGEIAALAAIFLRRFSEPLNRPAPSLADEARLVLESYV